MEEKNSCGYECGAEGCTRPAGTECAIAAECSCSDCEDCCDTEELTTLLSDTHRAVENQVMRDAAEKGEYTAGNYESYALLLKALEDKDAVSKDLKKNVENLWSGVKTENEDVVIAHFREIGRVAKEVAQKWIVIAALCEKAEETARYYR